MKRNLSSALGPLLLLLVALLSGCSKAEEPPPPPPSEQAKPNAAAAKPDAAVQAQATSAVKAAAAPFDFRNRRDPFKPYAPPTPTPPEAAPRSTAAPVEDLLPIQSFEVSRFKVAGIIAGITENRALVIDPNGKGYVVQRGMLIGNNDGRVSRITSSTVEVVENYREDSGRIKKRTIVLTLAKKRQGAF